MKINYKKGIIMNLGIVGCGAIGNALKLWIEEHNKDCKILIMDPPKGLNDDLTFCDAIFISIHIPTEEDNTQDLTLLKKIIKNLPDKPIFIRTTLLPGTCDNLTKEFNKKIYFMPEFLTERTAYQDFCEQTMVFTGEIELLKKIFKGKKYVEMTSLEAEISKYAHNVFGALKVTYFNGIYELAQKMNCDYQNVRKGVLLSGYINPMHTSVPGPDGKLGYGGKCFPKDVGAFMNVNKNTCLEKLLIEVEKSNKNYRKEQWIKTVR